MKHGELRAIGHNLADSLASGLCLVIGHFDTDVYGEAALSQGGALTIDFLGGRVIEGAASPSLTEAVRQFGETLPAFCSANGANVNDVREITARFTSDAVSRGYTVTVEHRAGRRSVTEYRGNPGRRTSVLDALGRVRRKPAMVTRPA
jgi:hypothetical protein